jgi:hypothetical protein
LNRVKVNPIVSTAIQELSITKTKDCTIEKIDISEEEKYILFLKFLAYFEK